MSTEKANIRIKIPTHQDFDKKAPEKVLLVEGRIDEAFIRRLVIEKLLCIPIGDVKDAEHKIKDEYKNFFEDHQINTNLIDYYSARDSVRDIVAEKEEQFDDIPFYGLVDKDFTQDESKENIMVTPTHDLETLLLKTDKTIFLSPEDMKKSYKDARYLAYLIGVVKKYLRPTYHLKSLQVDEKEGINDYKQVIDIDDKKIKLRELIERLIKKKLTKGEYEKIKKDIENSKIMDVSKKKVITHDKSFDVINGHDISKILKLLCKDQIDKFIKQYNTESHNCDVEFAIIGAYKLAEFNNSPLHDDLKDRGLIPTVRVLVSTVVPDTAE